MPFREATALVTVEREGVLDSFVTTLSRRERRWSKVPVERRATRPTCSCRCSRACAAAAGRRDVRQPTHRAGRPRQAGVQARHRGDRASAGRAHELDGRGHARRARSTACARRRRCACAVRTRRRRSRCRAGGEGRARGGRRGPARAACRTELGPARGDDERARHRGVDRDRADAGGRQAPLRPQGACRAAAAAGATAARELFDTLLLWKARVDARRERATRDVEMPLNDSLTASASSPSRRRRATASAPAQRDDPHHAGPDAALRPAAAGARRRPLRAPTFTLRNTTDAAR